MKRMMLVSMMLSVPPGCAIDIKYGYVRSWADKKPPLLVNDEPVEPNKQNLSDFYGMPSIIIPLTDRELCVWRNPWGSGKKGDLQIDYVVAFDADGNFLPTDGESLKRYCVVCWTNVSKGTNNECPRCRHTLPESGKKKPDADK